MTQMCTYFKTKTDVALNLVDKFFFELWLSEDLSIGKILREKKYGGTVLISEKTEALYVELNAALQINFFCLYQSIDRYGPDSSGQATFYGGHRITVLIWPVCFSECLSALDV